jgi:hypothetical protein
MKEKEEFKHALEMKQQEEIKAKAAKEIKASLTSPIGVKPRFG